MALDESKTPSFAPGLSFFLAHMTMQNEPDATTSISVFEVLHAIVRETTALDKAVGRLLLIDSTSLAGANKNIVSSELYKNTSFYQALEWKIDSGSLDLPQATKMLGIVLREIDRFRLMTQNLFGYLSLEQDIKVKKTPIMMRALLEELVELFEYIAADKGIEIKLHVVGDPVISVDKELVRRLFANLVDNAIKYSYSASEAKGKRFIVIECKRHSAYNDCLTEISSYGVGIEEDEIKSGHIFNYGTRGKYANDRGRDGTGIGLAEAKRIVGLHQGQLHIDSRRVVGDAFLTTVKIVLPKQ